MKSLYQNLTPKTLKLKNYYLKCRNKLTNSIKEANKKIKKGNFGLAMLNVSDLSN